jgi:DNA-binding transcriptional ArsR family regulator/protein-L-isoaspartate O-methyltransferase
MKSAATLDDKVLLLAALSDATRLRLLALLSRHELSVVELTHVTELGQSKVSTHLARLREQGLVSDRRAGTSAYYRFNDGVAEDTLRLWETLSATLSDRTIEHDLARAERVIEARDDKQSWHERMAGELERHYSPGRTWDSLARAFTGLVRLGDVLDVGAGDGTVAEMLAPHARRYVCLDVSRTLSEAACRRLATTKAARVLRADMHALPFLAESFDEVLVLNTLTYADKPAVVLAEVARVLRPRGRLVLVTLARHDHGEVATQYGHRQPGFQPRWLKKTLEARNFSVERAEISAREKKSPHFEVVTCFATKS